MEREIMETVLRDMLQDLNEIKQQGQHLVKLEESLETQRQVSLSIEQKLSSFSTLRVTLTNEQLATLKGAMKQEMDALRTELKKQPTSTNSYYSVFSASFRMEHFPIVVNTIMKWVVILTALAFVIWLITRFVR